MTPRLWVEHRVPFIFGVTTHREPLLEQVRSSMTFTNHKKQKQKQSGIPTFHFIAFHFNNARVLFPPLTIDCHTACCAGDQGLRWDCAKRRVYSEFRGAAPWASNCACCGGCFTTGKCIHSTLLVVQSSIFGLTGWQQLIVANAFAVTEDGTCTCIHTLKRWLSGLFLFHTANLT